MEETKNAKKVGIFSSIRTKILILVFLGILITAFSIITVSENVAKDSIEEITHNYMVDMAISYGEVAEILINDYEDEVVNYLEMALKEAKIKGVDSSYMYAVSKDGTMLYHPTKEKVGKAVENDAVKEILSKMGSGENLASKSEVIEYEFDGAGKYAAYYVTKDSSMILIMTADEADVTSPISHMQSIITIMGIVCLVVCVVIAIIISGRIISPVKKLTNVVENITNLDLRESDEEEKLCKRNDETGVMGNGIRKMRVKLLDVVADMLQQSSTLYEASENLHGSVKDTNELVEQVEQAVNDIAVGATSQAEETQTATEDVVTIGNMISETGEEIDKLKDSMDRIKKSNSTMLETMKELDKINAQTKESIETISEQTNTTNKSAQKIREVTAIIASIADETNLLSLNASIEAARAGESGRGFAVVAAQIQKLAEQSNDSAKQIEEISNLLIEDAENTVETMGSVRQIIFKQSENIEKTDKMFGEFNKELESAFLEIDNITARVENMDRARINVVDVVQSLTAIAEENAASTEETSASVTEVSSIINDISNNSDQLNQIANKLDEDMNNFKI